MVQVGLRYIWSLNEWLFLVIELWWVFIDIVCVVIVVGRLGGGTNSIPIPIPIPKSNAIVCVEMAIAEVVKISEIVNMTRISISIRININIRVIVAQVEVTTHIRINFCVLAWSVLWMSILVLVLVNVLRLVVCKGKQRVLN